MAREAGFDVMRLHGVLPHVPEAILIANVCVTEEVEHLVALVRADEREACADKTGEFAQKWWSIYCASNKHMETTRKAHDDFCALQAAIRARGNT
jgi:hypothetical protein